MYAEWGRRVAYIGRLISILRTACRIAEHSCRGSVTWNVGEVYMEFHAADTPVKETIMLDPTVLGISAGISSYQSIRPSIHCILIPS